MLCVLCLAALTVLAAAPEVKTGETASGKPRLEATQTMTAEATVLSIDKTKRMVKIATAQGETLEVECGKEVKNFGQIKTKDVVSITYNAKLTIEVEGPGAAGTSAEAAVDAAKPGDKPRAGMKAKVQYKANITAIDKAKGTFTLKGADGEEETFTARNKANLDKVKVGDLVVFTYEEALAVSVAKAGPKTAGQ
jgi:hypothetical protein